MVRDAAGKSFDLTSKAAIVRLLGKKSPLTSVVGTGLRILMRFRLLISQRCEAPSATPEASGGYLVLGPLRLGISPPVSVPSIMDFGVMLAMNKNRVAFGAS